MVLQSFTYTVSPQDSLAGAGVPALTGGTGKRADLAVAAIIDAYTRAQVMQPFLAAADQTDSQVARASRIQFMEHAVPGTLAAGDFPQAVAPQIRPRLYPPEVVLATATLLGQTRVLVGPDYNRLARPGTVITPTNSHAIYTVDQLYDGRPGRYFQFLTAGTPRDLLIAQDAATGPVGAGEPIDFVSIHGHNLPTDGSVTVEVYSDDVPVWHSGNLRAVKTPYEPSFYAIFPQVFNHRYWLIRIVGMTSAAPRLGEVVLGLSKILSRTPRWPVQLRFLDRAYQVESLAGEVWTAAAMTRYPQRGLDLNFLLQSPDEYAQLRDELFGASEGGLHPLVIVPYDLNPEVVHGTLASDAFFKVPSFNVWSASFTIQESAF